MKKKKKNHTHKHANGNTKYYFIKWEKMLSVHSYNEHIENNSSNTFAVLCSSRIFMDCVILTLSAVFFCSSFHSLIATASHYEISYTFAC